MCTAKQLSLADPDDGVHVHQNCVASCDGLADAVLILGLVAVVEEQLVGVGEAGRRSDAGVGGGHAQRIDASALSLRRERRCKEEDCKSSHAASVRAVSRAKSLHAFSA